MPASLDAPQFQGANDRLAGFSTGSEYGTFDGEPMAATWTLGEMRADPGRNMVVQGAQLGIDAEAWDMTASLTLRGNRGATRTKTSGLPSRNGWNRIRGEAHRIQLSFSKPAGEWSEATLARLLMRVGSHG